MLFRIVRPLQRKSSRNRYFVQRVPADVQASLSSAVHLAVPLGGELHELSIRPGQSDVRLSLRTADPTEFKVRHAAVSAHFARVWQSLREQAPVRLSHEQAVALSREVYLDEAVRAHRASPPTLYLTPDEWEVLLEDLETLDERGWADPGYLEERLGALVTRVLSSKAILRVDAASREMLLREFCRSLKQAYEHRRRNAEGDYSPDPKANRFPEWRDDDASHRGSTRHRTSRVPLKALVDEWWKEAKLVGLKPPTFESYRRTFNLLATFLGHDDASRVTREDVVAFKDHRLEMINPRSGERISPRTVKDTDLAALKSVFGWAVVNGKLSANPAAGVTLQRIKRTASRRGLTDDEANVILAAATGLKKGREQPETFYAKRWIPWLLAYTGARVGEIGQLRKQDVRQVGEHWTVTITPDAGTVKTDQMRTIVLHPHLLELGFAEFVTHASEGYLFVRVPQRGDVRGLLKGLKNRLREFVREVVKDRAVDPNHGWRHRFKTVCRQARVDPEVRDFIQGHTPRTIGERYGDMPLHAQWSELCKLPRYTVPT